MPRPPGAWPPEFRERAIAHYLARQHELSLPQIAHELGLHPNTLRRWVKSPIPRVGFSADAGDAETRELRRLRRENERLPEELEILKKAAAFFARETASNPLPPSGADGARLCLSRRRRGCLFTCRGGGGRCRIAPAPRSRSQP